MQKTRSRTAVLLLCLFAILSGGCFKSSAKAEKVSAKTALNEAVKFFDEQTSIKAKYTHSVQEGNYMSVYRSEINADKLSGTTKESIVKQIIKDGTPIAEETSENWYYDNGNGTRDIYISGAVKDTWNSFSKNTEKAIFDDLNFPAILQEGNKTGYTSIDAGYSQGVITITGSLKTPSILSIEDVLERKSENQGYVWKTAINVDSKTFRPLSVEISNKNEMISIRYLSYGETFDTAIPAVETPSVEHPVPVEPAKNE